MNMAAENEGLLVLLRPVALPFLSSMFLSIVLELPHSHRNAVMIQINVLMIFFPFVFTVDYSKGFGGKYGVQKDRMDKVL